MRVRKILIFASLLVLIIGAPDIIYAGNTFNCWSCHNMNFRSQCYNCNRCGWDICIYCGSCAYDCPGPIIEDNSPDPPPPVSSNSPDTIRNIQEPASTYNAAADVQHNSNYSSNYSSDYYDTNDNSDSPAGYLAGIAALFCFIFYKIIKKQNTFTPAKVSPQISSQKDNMPSHNKNNIRTEFTKSSYSVRKDKIMEQGNLELQIKNLSIGDSIVHGKKGPCKLISILGGDYEFKTKEGSIIKIKKHELKDVVIEVKYK